MISCVCNILRRTRIIRSCCIVLCSALANAQAIKERVAQRKAERAKQEKAEEIRKEKERRERGQKIDETLEERQRLQRKREAEKMKKEKEVSAAFHSSVFLFAGTLCPNCEDCLSALI
jgi:hypothetical protein